MYALWTMCLLAAVFPPAVLQSRNLNPLRMFPNRGAIRVLLPTAAAPDVAPPVLQCWEEQPLRAGNINDIFIYGQESNQTTWRLCRMNLAFRAIDSTQIRWNNEGSFTNDAR